MKLALQELSNIKIVMTQKSQSHIQHWNFSSYKQINQRHTFYFFGFVVRVVPIIYPILKILLWTPPKKKNIRKNHTHTHTQRKIKREVVEGDGTGSTPLVRQRSTGSSLRSGSIADSPAFILVGLRLLPEFLPYNLVGVEAMALSFIKILALVCEGLELSFGTELA